MTPGNSARTPFHRLLIANRGEIAIRVARTARRLGIETVAIYSDPDAKALHVAACGSAMRIGGALPSESYLSIDKVIDAARRSGADSVHPGYGFLAENADFADACRAAGLVFVGPQGASIRAMGDKAAAKAIMEQAGVPCIPGYRGEDQDDVALAHEAERVGYPIMIKAVAGGGGRGMRLVHQSADFVDQLRSARSEALGAFGNGRVLLERAIQKPRHVEIQVFGDRHGNAIHLGERDCSVQRRHQKLIEESPCPAISDDIRDRMGAASVSAVRELAYEGAGTLEFLLDPAGEFFFMEMNTRLQVEHPVTEEVTGLDLVELQLRVAAGEALGIAQEDVQRRGHAIEVRLVAEDETHGFLPQSGTISHWRAPDSVRVESAAGPGSAVPPQYDSMIAKLIAVGEDRESARRKLVLGLRQLHLSGIPTNRSFLIRCLENPVFAAGDATTDFIAEHIDRLRPRSGWSASEKVLAALLLYLPTASVIAPLQHSFPSSRRFTMNGEAVEATVMAGKTGSYVVEVDAERHIARLSNTGIDQIGVEIDGQLHRVMRMFDIDGLTIDLDGESVRIVDQSTGAGAAEGPGANGGAIRASMNGRVVACLAQAGAVLTKGDPVVVVEAMKMQHTHVAPSTGTLRELFVQADDQVTLGTILAQMESATDG